jgi:hypothetical protein
MSVTFTPLGSRVGEAVSLIAAEFDEMPGLRLTRAQVRRLCNLTDHDCDEALQHLCDERRLVRDHVGRYFRREFDY